MLSHKCHDFGKKVAEHKIGDLIFPQNFCLKRFSFEEELNEISKMYIGLHVKYSLFVFGVNKTLIFSAYFRNVLKYQIP